MSGRSKSKQGRRNGRRLKKYLGTLSRKGRKAYFRGLHKVGSVAKKVLAVEEVSRTPIEILIEANKTMCIVTGLSYDNAIKLQTELNETGIGANITTGGLQIYTSAKQPTVVKICKKHKTIPEPGVSRFVESAMLR